MKKIFLFSISLFLWAQIFAFQAKAESIVPDGVEHIESYAVDMVVNQDATVSVTEKISYDNGMQSNPGPIRYVPLNYQDLNGSNFSVEVSNVSVTDENNNPYVFATSRVLSADSKKLYLGIALGNQSESVTGAKTYIIHYVANGAIRFLNGHDEFFWDITGDRWPVYVKYPEIKVTLPQKIDSENVTKQCFVGLHKATMDCIDRLEGKKDMVADYSYKGLVAGQSMTTVVDFPKNIVQKKTVETETFWSKLKTNHQLQGMLLILSGTLLLVLIFVRKYLIKIVRFFSRKRVRGILIAVGKKMWLHHVHAHAKKHASKLKNKSRKWWITFGVIATFFVVAGTMFFWKIENTLNKISTKGESVGSIVQASLPNQGQVKGEADDRINILLLGILGANHPGGGLNTDTIMVASISPKANKISLVSIPRDLWVIDPGKNTKSKINAVYEYGEEKGAGQGIADMEKMVGDISGLSIDYAAVVSTQGFSQLVDTVGGVEIDLSKPFDESAQFADVNVCDPDVYTIPTGEFQTKKNKKGKVTAEYPLCKNKNPECGGDFHLPAGKNTLGGQQALCFVRSRYLTSDFERAKRQQLLLQQLKQKVTQLNFNEFGKVNAILDNLGNNVQTDMQLWEMRKIFDLYNGMKNPKIYQKVLEDSKQGLLYAPKSTPETGYILLPQGDNYDQIKELFQNVFNAGEQSDIKPRI